MNHVTKYNNYHVICVLVMDLIPKQPLKNLQEIDGFPFLYPG